MAVRQTPRQHVELGQIEWIHFSRNLPQDIQYLDRRFHFHPIDLRETLPPLQRHKIVVREDYIFIILLFPIFDPKTRIISSAEIDFFVKPDLLVTVNNGSLPSVRRLFETYKRDGIIRQDVASQGVASVVSSVLSGLLDSVFPMLLHLANDIDEIEKDLFKENQRHVIMEILRIKTNIVNVRKAMQGHKKIIEAFAHTAPAMLPGFSKKEEFADLIEHAKEIWDTLELQRDTINALHETHASLLENHTNNIVKTLTIFSVIIFPMTLVATIFTVNVGHQPFADDPLGFFKVLGLLVLVGVVMLYYFRKKRWI